MIRNLTFFETTKEIEELTGLSHDQLWEHGFNLDDMDWGFAIDGEDWFIKEPYYWAQDIRDKVNNEWEIITDYDQRILDAIAKDPDYDLEYETVINYDKEIPYWLERLLDMMEAYCVGYSVATYNGKTYVTQHHA